VTVEDLVVDDEHVGEGVDVVAVALDDAQFIFTTLGTTTSSG